MSKLIITSALAAVTGLVALAGSASAGTPLVDGRQNAQAHRIYQGVGSGRLSFGETQRLVHGQARVAAMKQAAKADGVVRPWERVRLGIAQNTQSRRIWRMKHN